MNKRFYSNTEFTALKERINKEMKRRGTYRWFDPLVSPMVGSDLRNPVSVPKDGYPVIVDDLTYTINTSSAGSIEATRNIDYPAHGDNPGGNTDTTDVPNTSAAQLNLDEIKNFLVGVAKVRDINLFYGRDEKKQTAFRNPQDIEDLVTNMEGDVLNEILTDDTTVDGLGDTGVLFPVPPGGGKINIGVDLNGQYTDPKMKNDPNGGIKNRRSPRYPETYAHIYDKEDGICVMKAGEYDGEEVTSPNGPDENNFFDDYGAEPGNANFRGINPHISEKVDRNWYDHDNQRNTVVTKRIEGARPSIRFGTTPRNPNRGDEYRSRPVYKGGSTTCNVACTGLCSLTCDNQCSESCFRAGTLVATEDGYVPIETIKVGDKVITKSGVAHYVYETFKRMTESKDCVAVHVDKMAPLYTTVNHPFWLRRDTGISHFNNHPQPEYTEAEWHDAVTINPGDKVYVDTLHPDKWVPVNLIELNIVPYEVYNISVEEDPTFYANGILVHNCTTTCFARCGNACTASCGNSCSGCTTLCYTSCQSKCQSNEGMACLKAGPKVVNIYSTGGHSGIPAQNHLDATTHTCGQQCSYSCQFYPNKKTQCWDAPCMGMCFSSCTNSCSTSCHGGCIDNESQNRGKYKKGIGRGCSSGCTANCIGTCLGTCQGSCMTACWKSCVSSCSDDCEVSCYSTCGNGCANNCETACQNECTSCAGTCSDKSTIRTNCADNGCTIMCAHGCDKNCVGTNCRSVCGTETSFSCEANCRLSCTGTSCTAMCSELCTSHCTSCVGTCGFGCGACSSMCATGCESACNITCVGDCQHSCNLNCMKSCTEACGGCSNLCYSCVGMCIGMCSYKCEVSCSNCANQCSWWCDNRCNQQCFGNCDNLCIYNCTGSCATHLTSETTTALPGPDRPPTAVGYVHPRPKNRDEEQQSFMIHSDPAEIKRKRDLMEAEEFFHTEEDPFDTRPKTKILITTDKDHNIYPIFTNIEVEGWESKYSTIHGGVWDVNQTTGEISITDEAVENMMREQHFENTDKKQSIVAILIYPDRNHPITKKDISFRLPIGYIPIKIYTLINNATVIIIQRLRDFL